MESEVTRSTSIFMLSFIFIPLLICLTFSNKAYACNLFRGSWVYDNSYPIYQPASCPFIRKEFDCIKFGRRDLFYLKYRWKPDSCDLPRFDGMDLLRRLRGKRIMFVGDSISLNQYESLLCLIHASAPNVWTRVGLRTDLFDGVRFEGYNLTVEYFPSHYLVDIDRRSIGRVLNLDSISAGHIWQGANVLVFNTGHWWPRNGPTQPWDFIQDRGKIVKDMDRNLAFSKALQTWAKWVDQSVAPYTEIFYQGISPDHYNGLNWGAKRQESCMRETQPILDPSKYLVGTLPQEAIVRNIIVTMTKPVHLLDVTFLSQLRKDAHPSKYNGINFRNDCSHWCIPGLPDTWNQLFYAALIQS